MDRDLGRDDWLQAARLALLKGGASEVRVERLARDLRVTKGSFYWHFKDREELLELLLREWEDDFAEIIKQLKGLRGRKALSLLLRLVVEQAPLGEKGMSPSDAAIFTWASVSPDVARRVNRAEKKRIKLLKQIIGYPDRTEILYLVWLGFVARGKRVPGSRKRFPRIARTMLELFPPENPRRNERPVRKS
jgi:AcrR family transcriptional regulator